MYRTYETHPTRNAYHGAAAPTAHGVGILPVLGAVASLGTQFLGAKGASDAARNARKTDMQLAEIAARRDRTAQVQARKRTTTYVYAGAAVVAVGILAWALTRGSSRRRDG